MMRSVDLHVHSNKSDGTLSPTELVRLAAKINLSAFALTDHDTTAGIKEAVDAGKEYGVEVIPGIEISTFYKDKEIHIVGLCLDYTNRNFLKAIGDEKERRDERNLLMAEKFCENGFPVTMDEMYEMFPDSIITRAHFASFLTKKGYVKDNNEAFDKYLGDGKPLYVPKDKKSPSEAIEIIKSAGGASILAHPLLYHLTGGELNNLCKELAQAGLTGIESMYSTYKGFDELTVRKLAREYGLLESGGSDFHGAQKPHIRLGDGMGNLMISYDYLRQIKEYVNYSPLE